MKHNKIVILDDHPVFLDGLKYVINEAEGFKVSALFRYEFELFDYLKNYRANIAIIDCSRPKDEMDFPILVRELMFSHPGMRILAVGENSKHNHMADTLYPAVQDYFCKSRHPGDLVSSLIKIRASICDNNLLNGRESCGLPSMSFDSIRKILSEKEIIILQHIHAGFSVSQTAQRFNRSVKTVSHQKRSAMKKLGLISDKQIFELKI